MKRLLFQISEWCWFYACTLVVSSVDAAREFATGMRDARELRAHLLQPEHLSENLSTGDNDCERLYRER